MLIGIGAASLTRAYELIAEDKDLIIVGDLKSTEDITIRVRNLVVLGFIIFSKTLTIHVVDTLYNGGSIRGKEAALSGKKWQNKIDEACLPRIQALGIDLSFNPDKTLRLGPTRATLLDMTPYVASPMDEMD